MAKFTRFKIDDPSTHPPSCKLVVVISLTLLEAEHLDITDDCYSIAQWDAEEGKWDAESYETRQRLNGGAEAVFWTPFPDAEDEIVEYLLANGYGNE